MLVVHATFPIDPDRREEALELTGTVAERSREEDGVLDYRVAIDADDRNLLRFFERYEDEAAFEAHLETDHVAELADALPDLLGDEPEITRFDVSEASDVEI